ncbi:phosphatidylinositol N-acetylglucosaminyltransferase subunit C [Atheta coriaria]|uniref:phosphatidylinositol N-acetylglucosaminyltransferase subunit C n=1 Tax=Dalotia coriaria TaxID=877792 RepID=UPI0031F40D4D
MATKPWRKILYEDQGYPDNYTDKLFLWNLKRAEKYKPTTLIDAIKGSLHLTEELCTVTLFILIYMFIYNEWLPNDTIFHSMNTLTILIFLVHRFSDKRDLRIKIGNDVRTLLIFFVFGQLFSPLLHTLTDTISTNTIYTMSTMMMLIHLIFFDYGVPIALVSNSFSLSAAVFASICLASRLASPKDAFILITIAIEMFVLFPLLRKKFQQTIIMSVLLIVINYGVLLHVSLLLTIEFTCLIIFINLICPMLYIRYQHFKDNIYGPWDEAIVQEADHINDLLLKKTS